MGNCVVCCISVVSVFIGGISTETTSQVYLIGSAAG